MDTNRKVFAGDLVRLFASKCTRNSILKNVALLKQTTVNRNMFNKFPCISEFNRTVDVTGDPREFLSSVIQDLPEISVMSTCAIQRTSTYI